MRGSAAAEEAGLVVGRTLERLREAVRPGISTAELDPPRPAPRPANSVLDNLAWRLHGFAPSRDFHEPLDEVVASLRA